MKLEEMKIKVKCIELDVEFESLGMAVREMKERYNVKINKSLLSRVLNTKYSCGKYVDENREIIALHWKSVDK